MSLPPPPLRSFASDNSAGAHPAVLEAMARANHGHALAYGLDDWTRGCEEDFRELFGADVATYLTFNGTGANVLALTALVGPGQAVLCARGSHIDTDETGAPERVIGTKLLAVEPVDGKIVPGHVDEAAGALGVPHHAQPGVVSITQSTEQGTVYTPAEVAAVCDAAHRHGLRVHVDGARLPNAVASLGGGAATVRAMTVDAGVDAVSFGGTKNGLVGGEAVVFLRPELAVHAPFLRKQVTQLPSKMRFVAAQFRAVLEGGLWLRLAEHANAMAVLLYEATRAVPGVAVAGPPAVNSLFPVLPATVIEPLREWCFFWDWVPSERRVRWMTAWDTTPDDVAHFASGVTSATARYLHSTIDSGVTFS